MDYQKSDGKIAVSPLFLGLVFVLLAMCALTWSYPELGTAAIARTIKISAFVPENKKDATLDHQQGGNVVMTKTDGTFVAFTFPAQFSATDTTIKAAAYPKDFFEADKPAPTGKNFVGKTYAFDLYTTSSATQMHTTEKPVFITIAYTVADTQGIDENTLAPYRQEEGGTDWELIPNAVIDTVNKQITFSTKKFSSFTILGTPVATAAPATTTMRSVSGGGAGNIITSILEKIIPPKPVAVPNAAATVLKSTALITKTLGAGLVDDQVLLLQKYLNAHGFLVAVKGPGSLGFETNRFGALTQKAVIKFQEVHAADILAPIFKKATGVVGPRTRQYINSHP